MLIYDESKHKAKVASKPRIYRNENLIPKKLSISQKLRTSDLVQKPNKLKLCAVLLDQSRNKKVSHRYLTHKFTRSEADSYDDLMLKEFFNWTEEAVKADEFDFKIIIASKFTVVNSESTNLKECNFRDTIDKTLTVANNSISFEQMVDSKYEVYKKRFEAKCRVLGQSTKIIPKTVDKQFFLTQETNTLESNLFGSKLYMESVTLTTNNIFENTKKLRESWVDNLNSKMPHSKDWPMSSLNDTDSYDESDEEKYDSMKIDECDKLNRLPLAMNGEIVLKNFSN